MLQCQQLIKLNEKTKRDSAKPLIWKQARSFSERSKVRLICHRQLKDICSAQRFFALDWILQYINFQQREGLYGWHKHRCTTQLSQQKYFLMLMGYFYGKELIFARDWSIQKLLHDIQFLSIPCLENKIHNDIKNNFDDYGFFLLLSLAYKFKIKWLKQKCQEDLIMMGFEQLNYNRYDLFQVDKEVLQEIIRLHEVLKINKDIVGLRDSDLRRILNQYCKTNNVELQISEMLASCQTSSQFQKVLEESDQQSEEVRKRTTTWNQNNYKKSFDSEEERKMSSSSISTKKISQEHGVVGKQLELDRLTNWSENMNKRGSMLIAEMKDIKSDILNEYKKQNNEKQDSIQEKFKRIEEVCQNQDTKFQNLKTQIQKMSPTTKKSYSTSKNLQVQKDFNENVSALTKSNETNDSNVGVFQKMPKLDRRFD